mmetsp:Transcript_25147/g.56786  ORF Transcript_25147/g.56786 Transcript_25147/m.56786 type:complete len:189 (-) Transcript_25147:12-578(-)
MFGGSGTFARMADDGIAKKRLKSSEDGVLSAVRGLLDNLESENEHVRRCVRQVESNHEVLPVVFDVEVVVTSRVDLTRIASWTLLAALERASSSSGAVLFPIWTVRVLLLKSIFSIQLLCTVSLQMARFLERGQIEEARLQLCWLCSRDSTNLDGEDLAAGTLESLAENLSDGFVAPLFWYCCRYFTG